jgi:hypothetical protein
VQNQTVGGRHRTSQASDQPQEKIKNQNCKIKNGSPVLARILLNQTVGGRQRNKPSYRPTTGENGSSLFYRDFGNTFYNLTSDF